MPEHVSSEPAFTPSTPRIKRGRRVQCFKQGPFDGKRGRVQSVWNGVATVEFETATITERVDCFEVIN